MHLTFFLLIACGTYLLILYYWYGILLSPMDGDEDLLTSVALLDIAREFIGSDSFRLLILVITDLFRWATVEVEAKLLVS